jgi:adenine deaminase
MEKHLLKKRIDAATGRIPADMVIENCKIIDVYNSSIIEGKKIAITDGYIVGIGDYQGIITVGTNDEDMVLAVENLVKQGGGIILVKNGNIINSMPMVVGGIMSDQPGEWVSEKLAQIHKDAYEQLGINKEIEPVMTLCFMSLAVIPEIKLTDKGLFDVTQYAFIPIEA